jgi:hypothetical protein
MYENIPFQGNDIPSTTNALLSGIGEFEIQMCH